jgi:hypothetical protein
MKIARLLAVAGLVVSTLAVPAAAEAQGYYGDRYGYDRDYRGHRGDDRRDFHRGWRGNGRHYGWDRGRGHQRCWTEYRRHRQVRVCG